MARRSELRLRLLEYLLPEAVGNLLGMGLADELQPEEAVEEAQPSSVEMELSIKVNE